MTHPVYSARFLSAKGLVRLRQIAKQLGVVPSDRRSIQSHVDAIVQHQANKLQKVQVKLLPTAVIGFESESGSGERPYMIIVQGRIVERFATYSQVERHCFGKYNISKECPFHEVLCEAGNDFLHPEDLSDDSVQPFEEYLESLVFDDSDDEKIDDYLFHDTKMERGSGRDKVRQLVAV